VKNIRTEFMSMLIIYLHTKFYTASSNDSLIIVGRPRGKCRLNAAMSFLSYIPKEYLQGTAYFSKVYY